MLESICSPLIAKEAYKQDDSGADVHVSSDLQEDHEYFEAESPKEPPKSCEVPRGAEVAFLTEADSSASADASTHSVGPKQIGRSRKGRVASEDSIGKGTAPSEESIGTQKEWSQSRRNNDREDASSSCGSTSTVAVVAPSDSDDGGSDDDGLVDLDQLISSEEELLAEFDQQLCLYFDCMRKEAEA